MQGVEDEAQGYYVEIRPIESLEWTRCNTTPITLTSYTVLGLKAMATYWVRVIATNYGGDGEPQSFDNYIIAMPPPGKKCSFYSLVIGYFLNEIYLFFTKCQRKYAVFLLIQHTYREEQLSRKSLQLSKNNVCVLYTHLISVDIRDGG